MKMMDFLEKKEKLFSNKTSPEEAKALGDFYLEAQRLHDAVAFYKKADYKEGFCRLRDMAVHSGDFQLLEEMVTDWDSESMDLVRTLAKRAEELGRLNDARRAYARVGDEVGQKRVAGALEELMGRSREGARVDTA